MSRALDFRDPSLILAVAVSATIAGVLSILQNSYWTAATLVLLIAFGWFTFTVFSRRAGGIRTSPSPIGVLGILVASIALDATIFATSVLAYGVVVVVGVSVVLARKRPLSIGTADLLLIFFVTWGLSAAIVGRVLLGQDDNTLTFFFALILAALPVVGIPTAFCSSSNLRLITSIIMWIGLAYTVTSTLLWNLGLTWLPANDFKHGRFYLTLMGLTAAILLGRKAIALTIFALASLTFIAYPALTIVIASLAIVFLIFSLRQGFMALALAPLVTLAMFVIATSAGAVRSDYFDAVGKIDNTPARQELLREGVKRFERSPVWGDWFSGNISVPSTVTGPYDRVPVHNDYLQIAMSGGVVGLIVAVVALGACAIGLFKVCSTVVRSGTLDVEVQRLGTVLLVGLFAIFVSAAFNPLVFDIKTSLMVGIFLLIGRYLREFHTDVDGSSSLPSEGRASQTAAKAAT